MIRLLRKGERNVPLVNVPEGCALPAGLISNMQSSSLHSNLCNNCHIAFSWTSTGSQSRGLVFCQPVTFTG